MELPRPDEPDDEIIDPEPKPYDGEPSDAEDSGGAASDHAPSLHDHIEAEPRDYEDDLYSPSEPGAVNVILRTSPNSEFLSRDREIRRAPGSHVKSKQLVQYCCTGSDELGLAAHAHDVSCLRVGECAVDLANPDHVLQIEGQLIPGAHVWFSLPSVSKGSANACKQGSQSKARAAKCKSKASEVIKHALRVAKNVISSGGHVSFVWPADDDAWSTSEWSQFEDGFHLFRSYFRGPLEGKEAPIRHRWAVSTTSLRILQLFGQHDLEGGISGEAKGPNPGSSFECTANLTSLIL